jgi:hypothetical protein
MLNKKFANVKFEIVDLSINAAPEMYLSTTNVLFTRRVLDDLENPQYVQFCIDPVSQVFAIRPCRQKENKAVEFLKDRKLKPNAALKFGNKNLHDTLAHMITDYVPGKRYKFTGEFDSENNIMYYDMTKGVPAIYHGKGAIASDEVAGIPDTVE